MFNKNVLFRIILVLMLASLVLAACGPSATPTEAPAEPMEPEETEEPMEEPMAEDQLEIFSWWTAGGEADGLNAMYEVFSAQYPDVEIINATVAGGAGSNAKAVLATRMQSGDPPDSFQVHAGHELIDSWVVADAMEPVTFIFEENGWLESYPPGVIDVLSYEGEIWSVPVNIHRGNVLWYNKAIFDEYGFEAPETFDDFFAIAETLAADGITPLALGDNGIWASTHLLEDVLLGTLGPDAYRGLWTGDTSWGSAGVTEALNTFAMIMGYVNEDHSALSWDQAAQLVADGDAAMTIMGDWAEGYFISIGQTPNAEFGWAPSPGTGGSFMMLSDSFGLPKGAPHRENAIAWLTVAGSREGQDAFNPLKGSIPARTDGDRSLYDEYLLSAMDDFASNEIAPSLAHGAAASEGWVTSVNDVMTFFTADLDVGAAQEGMMKACEDAGVCEAGAVVEEMAPEIGTADNPIKVLFVPSVDVDFMIESGDLIGQALSDATGLVYEVSVPTSYAATIEEMCASPDDTIGFIPAMGYALANQLCGVEPGLASVRFGWNVYFAQFIAQRDSGIETLEDLEGKSWGFGETTSTSGYLVPLAMLNEMGITPGEQVETGGHTETANAVYNGEVDFGTTFFSPPLVPDGEWQVGDPPDIPDELVPECGLNDEGQLWCGGYRVLDARQTIREQAPDVVQVVKIVDISPGIPNDTMSFSPDFPQDLKDMINEAVIAFVQTEECQESLCNPQFYEWTDAEPIFDENFDLIRIMMEEQGITLENIGE